MQPGTKWARLALAGGGAVGLILKEDVEQKRGPRGP